MSKTTKRFCPELRERAMRLVLDTEGQHGSRGQVTMSIAAKIGCSARAPRQQPGHQGDTDARQAARVTQANGSRRPPSDIFQ